MVHELIHYVSHLSPPLEFRALPRPNGLGRCKTACQVVSSGHTESVRAGELTLLENVHPPPSVTCHVSRVKCQVSGVTCIFSFFSLFFGQSGGASWWMVCYQPGLPRLVQQRYIYLFYPSHISREYLFQSTVVSIYRLTKSGFLTLSKCTFVDHGEYLRI